MENINKPYLIVIYGKDGCPLCVRLKKDVEETLKECGVQETVDLDYQNLSTTEGMIAYALAETVNGQRIPALQIMEWNDKKESYVKLRDRDREYSLNGRLIVPVYMQLETDYSREAPPIRREEIGELISRSGVRL